MPERFSLKDDLFNKTSVSYLADVFYKNDTAFPRQEFINNILEDFPGLELKERIARVRQELELVLPKDFPRACAVIIAALPIELDSKKSDGDFGNFIIAAISDYVVHNGMKSEYCDLSLQTLQEITKRFSAEDAIRYFINEFPQKTVSFLLNCARSDNYHVRRLASEGTRPRLPWSQNIIINYKDSMPILDILFSDSTRYVTRSVANHMNDISKIDPVYIVAALRRWQKSKKQNNDEMIYIMNHSLRTLVKRGNTSALELLGYSNKPRISVDSFSIQTPKVRIGEALLFEISITAQKSEKLIIDYIVNYYNPSGKISRKVFKIKNMTIHKGQKQIIKKRHPFRTMTTKKLYPGIHSIELQINGNKQHSGSFVLVKA